MISDIIRWTVWAIGQIAGAVASGIGKVAGAIGSGIVYIGKALASALTNLAKAATGWIGFLDRAWDTLVANVDSVVRTQIQMVNDTFGFISPFKFDFLAFFGNPLDWLLDRVADWWMGKEE